MGPADTNKPGTFRGEAALWVGAVTMALFLLFGKRWLSDLLFPGWYALMFVWLFATMLWLSFSVVRHADALATLLGEPLGTLILTLSVISIEVIMIAAMMLTGSENPTLARDTMMAVLMIVLCGMVGMALVLGGWRHTEQAHNLRGANAYLIVILPLATLGLVLPRFTQSAPGGQLAVNQGVFLALMSGGLYAVFLAIQTTRHRNLFVAGGESAHDHHAAHAVRSVPYHALFLVLTMVPVVLLSKSMAKVIDHGIEKLGAPAALGGFLVATLVLAPEALGAFRAALDNKLQRSVNICLGSALATIGLTIPAVLTIAMLNHMTIELGLDNREIVMLVLTLLVSVVSFTAERTTILHGVVHLILFVAYIMLIFD